jgi:hypothetical protein
MGSLALNHHLLLTCAKTSVYCSNDLPENKTTFLSQHFLKIGSTSTTFHIISNIASLLAAGSFR